MVTGASARPLSAAASGSLNITLKSMRRCSWGKVMPIASPSTGPSTVCALPAREDLAMGGTLARAPTLLLCVRAALWYTQAGSEVIAALSHSRPDP